MNKHGQAGIAAAGQNGTVDSPTELTKPSLMYVLRKTAREFSRDECTDLAAALTYYAVLSLFPSLLVIVSLLGVFGQGEKTVNSVLEVVAGLGPASAVDTLREPVEALVATPTAGVALVIGVAGALWSASGYVGAFGRAMNRMYEVDEGRPFWKLRPALLGITLIVLLLVAAIGLMLAISGPIARSVGDVIGAGDTALLVWNVARWPVILLLVVVAVELLYYATPNLAQLRFRWLSAGATLAIVVWIVASVLFGVYVSNFASYNKTYGTLAGVIVFLLWLWLTNLSLLFGAEFDAELERGRELQSGLPAEKTLQLPARDRTVSAKKAEARREDIARGRALRQSGGATGDQETGSPQRPKHGGGPRAAPDEIPGDPPPTDHSPRPKEGAQMSETYHQRRPADEVPTVELIERLNNEVSTLIRTEMSSAVAEVKTKGTRLGLGLGVSGGGLLIVLYGLGVLVAAAVLGLATVVADWLAALIVGGALVVVGAAAAGVGAMRARAATPPIPEDTAASVRADATTVKEHL